VLCLRCRINLREEVHNGWPYGSIEHWPPMTYRNRATQNPKALLAFDEFLNSEASSDKTMELQPWLPFCEGRCAFCYFPVSCERQKVAPYMDAMKKILAFYAQKKYVKSSVFNELYIGGGSPSVLANEQIVDLLKFCRGRFTLSSEHQTKFAACTTNLSEEKIRLLSENQVDQLDIGIQTFDDSFRKTLLLRDSSQDAKLKLKAVKKHGLRVSIDLLYNLPGQTVSQWKADVEEALALEVESVDCYPLDLYSETSLAKQIAAGETPPLGETETELTMYLEAYKIFKENGYLPACHNRFSRVKEDFNEPSSGVLGSGAGFFMGHVNRFQYSDIEDIEEYTTAVKNGMFPIARLSELAPEDEMRKAMMLIYIRKSVDREKFKAQFGKFPEDAFPNAISKLEKQKLIEIKQGKIQLTEKGDPWRFNIAWEFFS
jgi:coproporphyrinogen III oxidase-like Fe-S oxidoreductase